MSNTDAQRTAAELVLDEFEAELHRIDTLKPQPFKEKYVIPSLTVFVFIQRLRAELAALRAAPAPEPAKGSPR